MSESKTLAALFTEANDIGLKLIENEGEITPDLEERLNQLQIDLPEKVDAYVFIMEALEAQEAMYKKRAEFFSRLAKSHSGTRERIKERIKFLMQQGNKDEVLGNDYRFKLSPSKPSLKVNTELLPAKFTREVVLFEVDKKAIEEALMSGEDVPGAHFECGVTFRIYANKKKLDKPKKESVSTLPVY